jgi:5,10-methylenetetrahydromethanopterin reductase
MRDLRISCFLAPSKDAPTFARLAEELGYDGIYVYDSPSLFGDVWLSIGRMAEATSRITLGAGVAVPCLRHPMVTAAAIASIEELAPGRLVCGFGAGWSARFAMGQRSMRWEEMRQFFIQLRGLLNGETVEIDGAQCQMIHAPGFAPRRPIKTPLLAAASGPKGFEVARAVADGVFCDREIQGGFEYCLKFAVGTVLDPGEDHTSPRVRETAGPIYTTNFHGMFEIDPKMVDAMPGGVEWRARIETERPANERHLALHEGHLSAVTERDRPLLDAAGPLLLSATGWTGTPDVVRGHFDEAARSGATEIVMAMAGPDIPRELRAFAKAAGLSPPH